MSEEAPEFMALIWVYHRRLVAVCRSAASAFDDEFAQLGRTPISALRRLLSTSGAGYSTRQFVKGVAPMRRYVFLPW